MNSKKFIEKDFQISLYEFQELYTLLFEITDLESIKMEEVLRDENGKEDQVNHTDISNKSFIIELKRPDTKLFNVNNSRKNIFGISSEAVSAINQLNLYKLKKDFEQG